MNNHKRTSCRQGRRTMSDKYLSRAFAGLRKDDRPQTPSFAQTLARAQNKRQDKRPTWSRSMTRIAVPAAFVLLCLVSFLTLSGIDNGPDADLVRLAEKLGTWRAPTSTLVDEPEIFVSTESIATNQASWGTPTDSLFVELAYYQDDGL